ncbi:hypothetical protein F5Y12DRAFT_51685 [Xylaria sp. FL1777]|nr:hypothetical protein F5Y12DRAFT_51685 [Xylaria sp. FL1777]
MEAITTPLHPPSSLSGGPLVTRETSQTPGREAVQPQPIEAPTEAHTEAPTEAVPGGVDVDMDDGGRTSPSTSPPIATPASELVQSLPSRLPSARPSPGQTQPPSQQMQASSAHPQAIPTALHGQSVPSSAPQSYQHYRGPPSTTASSSSVPSPSQAGQPRRERRDMSMALRRFASPDPDHHTQNPRFDRDLSLLADAVHQSCPEAVRRVVRDKWEKCVVGSEFHHAFLMNATMHHASGTIMRRSIRDFGEKMVSEAKQEIVSHLKPQDIDDIGPVLLKKCSDQFLDKALEQRLKTIDARSLINALARAERLGYESSDILEDQPERVVPVTQTRNPGVPQVDLNMSKQPYRPSGVPAPVSLPYHPQQAQHAPATADLMCRLCWRQFQQTKPYEYHVQKQLCTKAASRPYRFWCEECGAGFTTKDGQQYHKGNAVCGLHATAAATPKPEGTPNYEGPPSMNYAHSAAPPTASQLYSTPSQSNAGSIENLTSLHDSPYRHLTPQRKSELDEELRQAEMSYAQRFKEAEQMSDPMARRSKLESLQNTFSTKQSIIRKKYGVRLRNRRTRAEIDEEKSRIMGFKHGFSSPGPMVETPSAKRQRSDDGSDNLGRSSYISRGPQAQVFIPSPTNHLSVSQMNNSGLGGSTATAATTDPTKSVSSGQLPSAEEQSATKSLSSLQRKGYRVSSHIGQATQPASNSTAQRNGSVSAPVVLEDSSDDEDTDEDIPATLPPKIIS